MEKAKLTLAEKGEVFLRVRVQPKSGRSEIVGLMEDGETVKVKLKAAPEGGKANAELAELLADYFQVSKSNVSVISGQTARLKLIKISRC